MQNERGFIKYLVIIFVILVIVFLSQQAYLRGFGKTLVSDATNQVKPYLAKGSNWVMSKIYPTISGEVQKRGDAIKNDVNQEKNKVSQTLGEKIKNYFSGVENSIVHPGTPQNCQPSQSSSSSGQ
jgi:hypothetical protein